MDGPLRVGQADGVACRTVEMFDAFGLRGKLIREAYWVNETVFWRPSKAVRSWIERTGRVQDTEDGSSEFPHLIVNQARMQKYLLDYMRNSPTRLEVNYGLEFVDLKVGTKANIRSWSLCATLPCPQKCPLNGLAATGPQWTSMDARNKFQVEIPRDLSRFSDRSGRSWTSLNVLGWWAV